MEAGESVCGGEAGGGGRLGEERGRWMKGCEDGWGGAGMVGLKTRGMHGSVSTSWEVVDSVVETGVDWRDSLRKWVDAWNGRMLFSLAGM